MHILVSTLVDETGPATELRYAGTRAECAKRRAKLLNQWRDEVKDKTFNAVVLEVRTTDNAARMR